MAEELNTALAEQIVNENRRLSSENQELLQLNEAMNLNMARLEELGGLDKIEEMLKNGNRSTEEEEILESFTRNLEQYGSLEVIEESLNQYSSFIEKHGPLTSIEESLEGAKDHLQKLADFVKENGSLEEVSESLSKIEDRMPRINEGLTLAKDARDFQEKFGTFEQIEEALTRSHALLKSQADAAKSARETKICESIGMTREEAQVMMDKHDVDLKGLQDLCESFGFKGKAKKEEEVKINESAPVKKAPTGALFLNMTRDPKHQKDAEEINESKKPAGDGKPNAFRDRSRLERMTS